MPAPTVQPGVATSTAINALAGYVDATRTGILARGRRTTSSSTTTTTVGVLRIDDVPIAGGYLVMLSTSPLGTVSSVANDAVRAELRYTTDGSTPTTSSPLVPGATYQEISSASGIKQGPIIGFYTPTSDETLSVLLTVTRVGGTGNVSIYADGANVTMDVWIESRGIDTGDVGVDI